MAADDGSLRATPKRKRGDSGIDITPLYTTTQFSFRLPDGQSDDDGSASPRTKVVHRFKGLDLNERGLSASGGGVSVPAPPPGQDTQPHPLQHEISSAGPSAIRDSDSSDDGDEGLTMRKRQKVPELVMLDADTVADIPPSSPTPTPTAALSVLAPAEGPIAPLEPEPEPQPITIRITSQSSDTAGLPELQHSYPSINRLQDSKSRSRQKRAGTPPLAKGRRKKMQEVAETDVPEVVDPLRASLTWHEDEITVYDPDDSDDDGTGVNGIGFKPTPALARIRTQKRRQQLLEYKKREDKEARARRNLRRQGGTAGPSSAAASAQQAMAERRVRFMEAGAGAVITMT